MGGAGSAGHPPGTGDPGTVTALSADRKIRSVPEHRWDLLNLETPTHGRTFSSTIGTRENLLLSRSESGLTGKSAVHSARDQRGWALCFPLTTFADNLFSGDGTGRVTGDDALVWGNPRRTRMATVCHGWERDQFGTSLSGEIRVGDPDEME